MNKENAIREAVSKHFAALFEEPSDAFQQIALHEENVFVAGSGAAVKWRGEGVGQTGKKVTFEGIDVFEINADGLTQTVWAYWKPQAVLAEVQDYG